MVPDPGRVTALFQDALGVSGATERTQFLDRECAGDERLRAQVDAMLETQAAPPDSDPYATVADTATHPSPDGQDSARAVETTAAASVATGRRRGREEDRLIGSVINGRYRLREGIGEGGMGTVFLADQDRPVRRQVAVKLIKPGMDSRSVLGRFEAERQALALMDHPNIAKVLDAGVTEAGRPYFVMELVRGEPLTDYCDRHRLGLPERLTLFRQVCSAIQHAHQKGVIHRDLKPTNILVETHDGKAVPRVIDFGLAKATGGLQLTDQSVNTVFGGLAGTPLYMAPEQAGYQSQDVDTRADVYALGVILYETLTGSTPVRRDRMNRAAFDEMLRLIREDEPATPSSRISESDTLRDIAASRRAEPAGLARYVRGDLDWVVMKALSKDRGRRYESAIALAQDVERFMNHEPVLAGPPTASYRLRKFARRNRGKVVAACLVLMALLAGVVGTTAGLIEARRQEGVARKAADEEKKARQAEAAEHQKAEARLAVVQRVNDILGALFKDLDPMGPGGDGRPLAVVLGERLDQTAAQINADSVGDPRAAAALLRNLAESQIGLGRRDQGIALHARIRDDLAGASGPDSPEALRALADHANAVTVADSNKKGLPLLDTAFKRMERALGPKHPDTLRTLVKLALAYTNSGRRDLSGPMFERAATKFEEVLGPADSDTIEAMMFHGLHSQRDRALAVLERTLALQQAHPGADPSHTIATMKWLAGFYFKTDRARCFALYEQAAALATARLGRDHFIALFCLRDLATAYRQAGQPEKALPLDEEVHRLFLAKFGEANDYAAGTLVPWLGLFDSYEAVGKPEKALAVLEDVYARRAARVGPEDKVLADLAQRLVGQYVARGKPERARDLAYRYAGFKPGVDPEGSTSQAKAILWLARARRRDGKPDDAVPLLREALKILESREPGSPAALEAASDLGDCLASQDKFDEARPLLWAGYEGLKKAGGQSPWSTSGTFRESAERIFALADRSGKPPGTADQCIPLYEDYFRHTHRSLGPYLPEAPRTLQALRRLAAVYIAFGRDDQAKAMVRTHAGVPEGDAGRGSLSEARASSWLGDAYLAQGKWPEAAAALREALTTLKAREPGAWTTFDVESMLGWALIFLNKRGEAEPLLRSGFEGLRRQAANIPDAERGRVAAAVDRLIALAEANKKPDEAAAWRSEKAKPLVPSGN